MIEFSSQSVDFTPDITSQTLVVTNKGDTAILFKVKTNNIKAIDAKPSTGSIPSRSNVKITIKKNQHFDDGVKLQITYLQYEGTITKDNFKQLWSKYVQSQKSKTLLVKYIGKNTTGQKKQQKTQGLRYTSEISQESQLQLFQSVIVNRKSIQQTQKNRASQITQQKIQKKQQQSKSSNINLNQLTKSLQQTKSQKKILQKKLQQQQNQIKSAQKDKQAVQKYLHIQKCPKSHYSVYTFIIVAILFFILGYYFGMPKTAATTNPHNSQI